MKSRITITLDPVAHQRAKRTARKRKTSVSALIERLLNEAASADAPSIVDQMIGSATLRESPVGADPLYDVLKARYLDS